MTEISETALMGKQSMKATFELHRAWGNTRFYPVDENAKLFAKLTEHKSLTKDDLKLVKELGFELEIIDKNSDYSDLLKKGK